MVLRSDEGWYSDPEDDKDVDVDGTGVELLIDRVCSP